MSDQDVVIRVQNLSKKFNSNLMQSIRYGIADITRNAVGLPAHSGALRPGEFWALDDVSFEVQRGDAVGIIGPNGAGKSTLLKLLNGIIAPDRGEIEVKGRVGTLIAVGAGFHPMLTGRENIYINGAILGMSRREIDRKLDSIVEFAELGDFIDTPVKFYSSGMYVRLGFAVAAHVDPGVLLIDEVLSVGDLSFRTKCYRRMHELKERGVTMLFVSHSMNLVSRVCARTIYLNHGKIHAVGETEEVVRIYEQDSQRGGDEGDTLETDSAVIREVRTCGENGEERSVFELGEKMVIKIFFSAKERITNPHFRVRVYNPEEIHCIFIKNAVDGFHISSIEGKGVVNVEIPELRLAPNVYRIDAYILSEDVLERYAFKTRACSFRVSSTIDRKGSGHGIYYPERKWTIEMEQDRYMRPDALTSDNGARAGLRG